MISKEIVKNFSVQKNYQTGENRLCLKINLFE